MQEVLRHELAVLFERLFERGVGQCSPSVWGPNREDPVHETQLKGAAVPNAGNAGIRHRIDRNHARQGTRTGTGKRVLSAADIAGAQRTDLAVAPRLPLDPGNSIVPVARVVYEHAPFPFRCE